MTTPDRIERVDWTKGLLSEINEELARRVDDATMLEQMRRSAITDLRSEVEKLLRILAIPRYKLVLIGQVGVGKTTAICHLAGLTAEREKKKKLPKSGVEKPFLITEDLMATGSGFTTLCEVEIKPTDTGINRAEVEPLSREEIERTLSEFCEAVWRKVYPGLEDAGQKKSEQLNFPVELVRAVRNMVKLPEGERQDEDSAMRLAREFKAEDFELFRSKVLSMADLDRRTQTEFTCPRDEADARGWIKKTCDDLNLARVDTVSIPHRITLHVDSNLLSPQMNRVASIVDTKGVDASQFNRADLDAYIREDDAALCVLTEGFDTAPTNVMPLLQRHIVRELPLSPSKFVLMVLPRGSEPEKVVGAHGPVGERDAGIDLRRNQIEDTLPGFGLPRLAERLIFFDPLRHFEFVGVDYQRRADAEPLEIQDERDQVWSAISYAIAMRQENVWKRVPQIKESLNKIKDGKGLNPAEENLVSQARQRILEYRHIALANADRFVELFRALWVGPGARHHMSLRATNNRFGVYPPRNIDVYYDAIPISEQLVRAATSGAKEAVLEIVRTARSSSPDESDLRELFAVLEKRIDSSFEEMVRAVGVRMQSHLHDLAFYPRDQNNEFWNNVQARYGAGPGFREDVLSMYADQMEGVEGVLATAADESWRNLVIDPILRYLG